MRLSVFAREPVPCKDARFAKELSGPVLVVIIFKQADVSYAIRSHLDMRSLSGQVALHSRHGL